MSERVRLTEEEADGIRVVSGSAHPELAQDVADYMGVELFPVERKRFADGELYTRYDDHTNVRGRHVFIIQPHAQGNPETGNLTVSEAIMEQCFMIDAAKRASAARVTAVAPIFGYARQERKARGREAISAKVIANFMTVAGVDRIVSIDLHANQIQGFIDNPFDHMTAVPVLRKAIKQEIGDAKKSTIVMAAPDYGRQKANNKDYARKLGIGSILVPKERDVKDSQKIIRPESIEGVGGKTCFIYDDMIDTAGTLVGAANVLHDSGAKRIVAVTSHGLFSGPAAERIEDSPIDKVITTDSVYLGRITDKLGDRLKVVSIAGLLGETITAIVTNGSVSKIFKGANAS